MAVRLGLSPYDVLLAFLAPIIALYLRDALHFEPERISLTITYCIISAAFSLVAFAAFGINRGIPEFLTVRDVLTLTKAVFVGEVLTSTILFSVTRLDGVPRSVPAIHALTLAGGLFSIRLIAHFVGTKRRPTVDTHSGIEDAVILIGITKLSALYMRLVEAIEHRRERIVALLDEQPLRIGRTVNGISVLGRPADLDRLVEDFAHHGIQIGRVVLASEDVLSAEAFDEVRRVCVARGLDLTMIPQLLGLDSGKPPGKTTTDGVIANTLPGATAVTLPAYLRYKRLVSFILVIPLMIVLAPLLIVVAAIAFTDVGLPLFFWQQRMGLNGRTFLVYKLRTLKEPFDWRGERIPEEQRLSKLGRMLRKLRVDELPQLLNVLVGDMAFIGPRPLLLRDQPASASLRLMIRPGITGWAQVNGGLLLSPEEKGALDEWYIRNASAWLDLRIILLTLRAVICGDRRSEITLERARTLEGATKGSDTRPDGVPHLGTAEPKRIIFLNRYFYPDQSATSQMLTDLACELSQSGHDVHVFTSRQLYDDPGALLSETDRIGRVTIHRVKTTRFGRGALIGRAFDYLSFYRAVWRSVLAWARPGDVLVAKTDPPLLGVLAMYAAKRRDLRLVNWLQDVYPEIAAKLGVPLVKGPLGRRLLRLRDASLRLADANVVVGERMADTLQARGIAPERVHVISNWCDDEEIEPVPHGENPLRREWQIDREFVIEYSGNLGRAHEFDTVLAAAELLRDEPRILFVFVGGGKKFDQLRQRVSARSLDSRFRFLPYQDRSALKYSLSAADLHLVSLKPELEGLIVPSKFYGIAAAGRATIAITASDGEIAKLVRQHDCGIVVEPGQGAILADALRSLMNDRGRVEAMGRHARAMLDRNFTRQHAFERWGKLFDNLLGRVARAIPAKAATNYAAEIRVDALSET